jgi:hypothetical protein
MRELAKRAYLGVEYQDGIEVVNVWGLPPPNSVIRVRTGAVPSVRPPSRRSTIPTCSVRARVKTFRLKNFSGWR